MKTLAKITFFIISALSTLQLSAQCTPDNNMPKGSILPQSIKIGYKDVAYSEVIYFRAPSDTSTMVGSTSFPVRIDSMEITGVKGLPNGFTYNCFTSNCRFNGGESSCLTLTGIPTQNGVYPLVVYISTYPTLKGFVDVPLPVQNDSNTNYTLYVYGSVGYLENTLDNHISVFPNPAKDVLNITTTSSPKITVQLFDINGKLQMEQVIEASATIDLKTLTKGIYILKLNNSAQHITRKIVVE
ncbi:MAG: T9SS type A sorting domain-containing protein [Bacteroidia bacterium]